MRFPQLLPRAKQLIATLQEALDQATHTPRGKAGALIFAYLKCAELPWYRHQVTGYALFKGLLTHACCWLRAAWA